MNEVWKDIDGYEGIYQVSNLGRIKRIAKVRGGGKELIRNHKVMQPKRNKTKYFQVTLSKNGCLKTYSVHRLVAIAFVDNPKNLPYVNHINGNGLDNRYDNLEWVTNRENQLHACYTTKTVKNVKAVRMYDKRTKDLICTFASVSRAAEWLLNNGKTKDKTCLTGIIKACKHKIPSYLGYVWLYESEVKNNAKYRGTKKGL